MDIQSYLVYLLKECNTSNSSFQHFKRNHKNGNLYLGGQYEINQGLLSIGGNAINAAMNNVFIMYVAAFDAGGNNLWVKQSSNDKDCRFYKLLASQDDILYILAGSAKHTLFNGDTLIHGPMNTVTSWRRNVILCMDSSGNNLWRVQANDTVSFGTDFFNINNMSLFNNTLAIVGNKRDSKTGSLGNDTIPSGTYGYLATLQAATGRIDSFHKIYFGMGDYGANLIGVTADKNGNFTVTGKDNFTTVNFSNVLQIQSALSAPWFIAQYGTNNCNCDIPKPDFVMSNPGGGNSYNFFYSGSLPNTSISWDFGDGSPTVSTLNAAHTYTTNGTYPVCVTTTNACGTNTRCRYVYITNATSISSLDGFEDLKVYPNPAKESITIESSENLNDVKIYNSLGMMVKQQSLSGNQHHIAIHDWIPGVYFLRFTNREGKQESWSFVKE